MDTTHPRGRAARPAVLAGLLFALVVLVPAPAGAHSLGGVEPSNYQSRVLALRPAVPQLQVRVVDAGTRLQLVNSGTRDVIVLGYQFEPYLRVGPGGAFENTRSPAVYLAGQRRVDAPPPATADPNAPPSWRRIGTGPSVAWHDHRAHWMGTQAPPAVQRAPGAVHEVIPSWTVKLRYGDQLVDVVGDVRWLPGPSPLPWLVAAALLGAAVVAASRTAAWRAVLVAVTGMVVALDLLQAAGAWAGTQAPAAGKLLSVGVSVAGWLVAGLAIRQLLRRRLESGLFQLLLAAGLLTVVGGLGDLGFLLRSQLASALPAWAVRAAVAGKVGLGVGAAVAAGLRLPQVLLGQAGGPRPGARDDRRPALASVTTLPTAYDDRPGGA
ncbi:MAG TPA: hypothetical protein VFD04_21750 [Actinomycetes bacterium]|jgi:hypothetical protein|nr:hypothetical protein [Actinomycetes bacterium]